ncbi:hypothetical protein J3A83DRAFT_4359966 [Scleroderma citrinum]
MASIQCNGCNNNFSLPGYSQHLSQTSNPHCITIYQQSQTYCPGTAHRGVGMDIIQSGVDNEAFQIKEDQENQESDELFFRDEDEMDDEGHVAENEKAWKPTISKTGAMAAYEDADANKNNNQSGMLDSNVSQQSTTMEIHESSHNNTYIHSFPLQSAGLPIQNLDTSAYHQYQDKLHNKMNMWAPFTSKIDFEVTQCARLCRPGSTALTELLEIDGLNNIIDKRLPSKHAHFQQQEIVVGGESYDVYFHDVVQCIQALYGDPKFAQQLVYVPEHHYSDPEMRWLWETQPSNHAYILLGYLPTTHLDHISNQSAWCHSITNLFHACGDWGIELCSRDGVVWCGHLLLACYIGDYPEQILVSGMITGDCPNTNTPFELCDLQSILAILSQVDEDPLVLGPFWVNLPFANIFDSLTPNGIIKHSFGECLPPNHNILTGAEHNQICQFLLGVIIDICFSNGASPVHLVHTLCALLNFLHLAQYPQYTEMTLQLLNDALEHFHANKEILLHACCHYANMIWRFGTMDSYNTEYTEQLHIDLAKDAYQATNHKGEYDQMTLWLECCEKIIWHSNFITWQHHTALGNASISTNRGIVKHPSVRWVSIEALSIEYTLACFVYHNESGGSESSLSGSSITIDSIHACPKCQDGQGQDTPACFNTGLVAQVQVMFSLPEIICQQLFNPMIDCQIPKHLAYVEWFTPFLTN